MLKKLTLYLLLLLVVLTLAAATPANGSDLDAILARSAVKGYLTSLKYNPATRSNLLTFYLVEEVANAEITQSLSSRQIGSYEIAGERWLNDSIYQVNAALKDEPRLLIAEVQKIGHRWKITSLAWNDAASSLEELPAVSTANNATATVAVRQRAVAAHAQVLAPALNVRSGPGTAYLAQSTLQKGAQVEIIGVSSSGYWYQVARDGDIIGWISTASAYVAVSPSPLDANIPIVIPAGPRAMAMAPAAASGGEKMILQTKSGDDFYLVNANFSPFADGTKVRYLTRGIDPALSPDGTKVAFTRWDSGDGGSVWLYDLATGKEWAIEGRSKQAKSPTWSPDGSRLVINFQEGGRLEGKSHCYDSRSDGSFPGLPHRAYDIEFNDGQLCFKLPPDPFWRLRLVDVATGKPTGLPADLYSFAPTWDPANDWRVVFAGESGLQQLDLNRNEYFSFGVADLRDRGPVFSPDGRKVATTYKQHQHWEIYTIDAKTGERARLTPVSPLVESFNSAAPTWSPNGQKIAFVSDRSGQWEFWVMNADGSNPRPLLPPDIAAQIPVEYNGVDERLISWGK